jgi:hypothetical protein
LVQGEILEAASRLFWSLLEFNSQAPSSKSQRTPNVQPPTYSDVVEGWVLGVRWSLELGAWDFILPNHQAVH